MTRELKPDLVVLDITMPVMNGLEAAREIRRLAPATKILILTMHDSPQVEEVAMEAGADGFLLKSTAAAELAVTVRRLLGLPGSGTIEY